MAFQCLGGQFNLPVQHQPRGAYCAGYPTLTPGKEFDGAHGIAAAVLMYAVENMPDKLRPSMFYKRASQHHAFRVKHTGQIADGEPQIQGSLFQHVLGKRMPLTVSDDMA